MALIAKEVQGSVPERLRCFVAENLEALEPGLKVLETSFRLGRSTVDVVAVDGQQTLVLVAVAEVADASMLIGTLDAYIWCLAFPDNMGRLYPDAIAPTRPPRVVLVATKMPAAFLDLVERLSVINPECHELALIPDEDLPAASATTEAGLTAALRPIDDAVAEPPLPVAEPQLVNVEAEIVQPAARVSAGFDAAVARQWESFLVETPVGVSERQAETPTAAAASTTAWPPRVPFYRTPTGQSSNALTATMPTTGAAADGHLTKNPGANRPNAPSETDEPITRRTLMNGHIANGKAGSGEVRVAPPAEAPLAEAIRAAEPAHVEHAAVNLGVRPRADVRAASAAPTLATASRIVAEPKSVASRPAHDETRTVNHPALQALRFPKTGVSRQWQEFLDQLAANQ
ncbi:MAG TPA: hypothetical protein VFU40_00405, partial [Gemmatimonadales bacterium]|nr:hypothetical protein [Gemmatimonadales bacterium]